MRCHLIMSIWFNLLQIDLSILTIRNSYALQWRSLRIPVKDWNRALTDELVCTPPLNGCVDHCESHLRTRIRKFMTCDCFFPHRCKYCWVWWLETQMMKMIRFIFKLQKKFFHESGSTRNRIWMSGGASWHWARDIHWRSDQMCCNGVRGRTTKVWW
jgi:hypothetical protein